jgi:hypothetical protein
MEKLTVQNELRLLEKAFRSNEFIGNGSSRAVYGLDEKTVIKVVADDGGKMQNRLEAEAYAKHRNNKLAKVYAVGQFVLVMERVRLDEVDRDEFRTVRNYLEDITGCHGDNYQIGTALDGRTVAYDYGVSTKLENVYFSDMVGDIRYAIRRSGGEMKLLQETKKKVIKSIFG